jgi:hypothetical protein
MEFLYAEDTVCTFMRPDTFEQLEIANTVLGPATRFLQPGQELAVEFFAGEPISIVVPQVAEARLATICRVRDWFNSTRVPGSCDRVPRKLATSYPHTPANRSQELKQVLETTQLGQLVCLPGEATVRPVPQRNFR